MFNLRRHAAGTILIAALIALAGSTVGQDPVQTTLTIIVRAKPDLKEPEILSTFIRGLSKSNCLIDGKPLIRVVPPTAYEALETLLTPTGQTQAADADTPLAPRLIPAREILWEFRLAEPTQVMKKLIVYYRIAGAKHYEPKDPRHDANAPLTLTALGRYALRPEANDDPVKYEITVLALGKKPAVVKGEWPQRQQYFVITLRNFRGADADRKRFFKTIQDGNEVPNPLTLLDTAREHSFIFANLGIDTPDEGIILDGNVLRIRVAGLPQRKVRRVWMYFPLTQDQYLQARDEYRKFDPERLSQEIRKKKIPVTVKAEMGAATDPQWIELGEEFPNRQVFSREIALQVDAKLKTKYPTVWRLLVWEFDDGVAPPTAIGVKHNPDGRVFLLEREVLRWADVVFRPAPKK